MDFLLRSRSTVSGLPSRRQVMDAYRGILREARAFFDDTTRDFITTYAKREFRKNHHDKKTQRSRRKLQGARTTIHLLERANAHHFKDVVSVLEYGYGRKGPRKVQLLHAMAKIAPRDLVFGNLREVAKYRPAFYAIAERQFGTKKLTVSNEELKSKHPLNVAKMQDRHWHQLRHRTVPPIDRPTMELVEERARTGAVTNSLLRCKDLSAEDARVLRMWEQRWVKLPQKAQVIRYYRALLTNMDIMDVRIDMVPNKGKYLKSMPRRNILDASGAVKPDLIPKKAFTFHKSSLAGKKPPSTANSIDVFNPPSPAM
ncbi:hypothetical protein LPJ59_001858 [Coemansia sp. RSA 2399]|nr:hypothetical protein LPJ59_001858 [Coemansia sp. RSA 2399]KAJ1905750.1 hypothetical protein LPJ81_001754 [Coemansia sp. IMI 209127]